MKKMKKRKKKLGVGGTCKMKQTCESNGPLKKKRSNNLT